jgi:hypothetical protein
MVLATPLLYAQEEAKLLESLKAADYKDQPAVYAYDRTDVTVEDSGLSHVVHKVLIKILDGEGAKKFSSLRFDYDPASSWVEIRKVSVWHEGKETALDLAALVDLPQPQYMIYWGARMKLLDVPRLEPGDGLYYETYMKGFQIAYLQQETDGKYVPPMLGHFYDQVIFGDELPIKEKTYTLRLPKDKPLNSEIYHGAVKVKTAFDDTTAITTWWADDIPALEEEPRMVEWRDAATKLVLATVRDWPEKSRWFFQINDPQFDFNDEIKAQVKEITRACADDDCRVDALLHWTANNIRYSGISMGKGEGYTLHTGVMDFHDRCGVCKDIAGMLVTLLRAAGYTVYPAMTMAGATVEQVPADQFNHCVVAWKKKDGTFRMLDPTWCPFSMETWSSAEQNQNYVIGSPEGEQLMEIPTFPPERNLVSIKLDGTFLSDGTLNGVITAQGRGYSDAGLRWPFANGFRADWEPAVRRWAAALSSEARVTDWKITDPFDLTKPVVLTIRFEAPRYAWVTEGGLVFTPPALRFLLDSRRWADFPSAVKSEERKYPVWLRCNRDIRLEEAYTLLPGYAAGKLPDKKEIKEKAGSYIFSPSSTTALKKAPATVAFSHRFVIERRTIEVEEYPGFRKAAQAFLDFDKTLITLAKGGN